MRIWSFICGWLKLNCPINVAAAQAGTRIVRYKVAEKLATICLLGLISTVQGADKETNTSTEANLPDLEFLEFLGQFATDNGEWVAPGILMAEEFKILLEAAIRAEQDENSNGNRNDSANQQQRNNR